MAWARSGSLRSKCLALPIYLTRGLPHHVHTFQQPISACTAAYWHYIDTTPPLPFSKATQICTGSLFFYRRKLFTREGRGDSLLYFSGWFKGSQELRSSAEGCAGILSCRAARAIPHP